MARRYEANARATAAAIGLAMMAAMWGVGCTGESTTPDGAGGQGGASSGGTSSGGASSGGASSGGTSPGGASSGGAATGGGGGTLSCVVAADCTWTEIPHEILAAEDCICLFGCPYVLVNSTTAQRRAARHAALCDPNTDGQGNPCPIDDCIMPPTPECVGGECMAPAFP